MPIWSPEAVKALRLQMGLSQEAFGELAGVSRQAVSEWENGKTEVSDLNGASLDRLALGAVAPPRAAAGDAIPAAIIQHARRQVAETHRDLSRIYGYAESIADLAEQVATKQRGLLTMLSPWVGTETDVKSGAIGDVLGLLDKMDAGEIPTPSAPADAPPAARKGRRKSAG